MQVVIQAAIYHGGKPLCEAQKTREAVVSSDGEARWNQELHFPIKVYNIPRMARLCYVIYEVSKTAKGKSRRLKDPNKVGFGKISVHLCLLFSEEGKSCRSFPG